LHLPYEKELNLKILYYMAVFMMLLHARNYEEKYLKDSLYLPKGFGLHSDLGYSVYLIELHSSELDSAISYDVLEFTLGGSYSYSDWLFGVYGKFLVDEIESNMYVVTTHSPLNNHANIEKDEFALYLNRTLKKGEKNLWRVNIIYRYSLLNTVDRYGSFHHYSSNFSYQTDGLALSLFYDKKLNQRDSLSLGGGLVYSRAEVKMSEFIDDEPQDSFVDNKVNALGVKLSLAYNHKLFSDFFLNLRVDGWQHHFEKLPVTSRVGDNLPSAELRENSYTTYGGVSWRF